MSNGEVNYDRINDYGAVRISLASPGDIRSWSFGEVKKPETINYRTYRPEKDGLFCERIFGPEKDWECSCGKYRGMKYKGMVCDRCGVKVTHSRVRRKRMGHIELAAPVVHIWFFKAMPSRLGTLLDMKTTSLEKIIYFQDYVVIRADPETKLKVGELLTDEQYREKREKFGEQAFDAEMGAEAIKKLLDETRLKLPELADELRGKLTNELKKEKQSKQKLRELVKRLKVVEALRDSGLNNGQPNKSEWMVLDAIPVIPPDLRPLVLLDSGNFATSDLNDLYRRIINRNNRLKKLVDLNAPEVIIRNEKRMLQQSVDALFDNNRCKRPVLGSSNRPLKSLTDMIKGKQGRFRENLLGKRVDYSARSVIVVGPDIRLHQCGLPKKIALELYQPFIIRRLKELGHADTIKSAKKMLERKDEQVWDILEEVIKNHPVLLNRAPTLHRMGIQAFEPVLIEGNAIRIHPLVCKGFNADFDGDQMAVHLPLSIEAQVEAHVLMMSTNNIFSPANGQPIISPSQDIVMGCYYLTAARGLERPGANVERYEPAGMMKGLRFALDEPCEAGEGMIFSNIKEVHIAWQHKRLGVHARVQVRLPMATVVIGDGTMSRFDAGQMVTSEQLDAEQRRVKTTKVTQSGASAYSVGQLVSTHAFEEEVKRLDRAGKEVPVGEKLPTAARVYPKKLISEIRTEKGMTITEVPRKPSGLVQTTVGRVLFNDILHPQMAFYDVSMTSKQLARVISDCYLLLGRRDTIDLLDRMKETGFKESTRSGLSFATDDLKTPANKESVLKATSLQVDDFLAQYDEGNITELERYNNVIDLWTGARDQITKAMMEDLKNDRRDGKPYLNPIYLMAYSGARGGVEQIRQLCGMRGLMAKPNGTIIETPIKANFREGLSVLEYFSSTHGARKGLADTALKTADSGYLTRKLADVAQNVVITMMDCGTTLGISKATMYKGDEVDRPLSESIRGRVSRSMVVNPATDEVVVKENEMITVDAARKIEAMGIDKILVRSPMTCQAALGVCRRCYGMDLSTGSLVEEGMAVGIIAAQSIGEPGTQLTMRTFHIGGVVKIELGDSTAKSKKGGVVRYERITDVINSQNKRIALSNGTGELVILQKDRIIETFSIPNGSELMVQNGQIVQPGEIVAKWDPYITPIVSDKGGRVSFHQLVEGQTLRKEKDDALGAERWLIMEHKGDLHPQVLLDDKDGKRVASYFLPERAVVDVREGDVISPGTIVAKMPRESAGTQDITGGLPRVTEIFEARMPRNPAKMSEVDGIVEFGARKRGKQEIFVHEQTVDGKSTGRKVEHIVPTGKHVRVQNGERVRKGDRLVSGPLVPHDILKIIGPEAVQDYLVQEVQAVYRAQRVEIDDKHIEIIVSQMLRKVMIKSGGDTGLLPGSVIDRFTLLAVNDRMKEFVKITHPGDSKFEIDKVIPKEVYEEERARLEVENKEPPTWKAPDPATWSTQLLGITKAAVSSESFISAASFQETTKVLTEAALQGKMDYLVGLKENVILGHLIPAGTGFRTHQDSEVKLNGVPLSFGRQRVEEEPAQPESLQTADSD
jgi:DNA-directed RNA polymerase subunit beta'